MHDFEKQTDLAIGYENLEKWLKRHGINRGTLYGSRRYSDNSDVTLIANGQTVPMKDFHPAGADWFTEEDNGCLVVYPLVVKLLSNFGVKTDK